MIGGVLIEAESGEPVDAVRRESRQDVARWAFAKLRRSRPTYVVEVWMHGRLVEVIR